MHLPRLTTVRDWRRIPAQLGRDLARHVRADARAQPEAGGERRRHADRARLEPVGETFVALQRAWNFTG